MGSEPCRKLTRPRAESIRTAVFERCDAANTVFFEATKHAFVARIRDIPELVSDSAKTTLPSIVAVPANIFLMVRPPIDAIHENTSPLPFAVEKNKRRNR